MNPSSRQNTSAPRHLMLYFFICLAAFITLLLLNCRTVYTADDYMYHFFWESSMPTEATRPMNGIADLPLSLWNHYNGFNGRIVSHAFVMFFMMYDKMLFNICNSLVYVITGWLLLAYIEPDRRKWNPWYLAAVYLAMLVFFPSFGWSVLWLAGACNYLWTNALILAFFLPYHFYMDTSRTGRHSFLKALAMILPGFMAGGSNENTGGAIVLLSLLFIGHWAFTKKKIPLWSITGTLSACAGMAVTLLAPSSRSRITSEPLQLSTYLKRIRELIGFSYHYILLLLIVLAVIVYFFIKYRKENQEEWRGDLIVPFYYCISAAASVIVLLASPLISGKSWILAVNFLIILIGRFALKMSYDGYPVKRGIQTASVLLCIFAALTFGFAWKDLSRTYREVQMQVQMISEQKAQGIMDTEVFLLTPTENTYNATRHSPNVSDNKNDWFNQWMARYYGVDSVTGTKAGPEI